MAISISHEEMGHFNKIYESLRKNFPKRCGCCGKTYKNEAHYNFETSENEGVTNMFNFGLGFLFYRNCSCGSTLGLNINPEEFGNKEQADFISYLDRRTNRRIRKLEKEAFESKIGELRTNKINMDLLNQTRTEVKNKINPELIYDHILQEVRSEYNVYLGEHLENGDSYLVQEDNYPTE